MFQCRAADPLMEGDRDRFNKASLSLILALNFSLSAHDLHTP